MPRVLTQDPLELCGFVLGVTGSPWVSFREGSISCQLLLRELCLCPVSWDKPCLPGQP